MRGAEFCKVIHYGFVQHSFPPHPTLSPRKELGERGNLYLTCAKIVRVQSGVDYGKKQPNSPYILFFIPI